MKVDLKQLNRDELFAVKQKLDNAWANWNYAPTESNWLELQSAQLALRAVIERARKTA